jgi:hypothetical protein
MAANPGDGLAWNGGGRGGGRGEGGGGDGGILKFSKSFWCKGAGRGGFEGGDGREEGVVVVVPSYLPGYK